MQGYTADQLEVALGKLWRLVRGRLTAEELRYLGANPASTHKDIQGIFDELFWFGPDGPAGLGLGRKGEHHNMRKHHEYSC